MKHDLEISSRKEATGIRITVGGDVDMESSPRLLEAIRAALKDASSVELDLKEVAYIDSSGIAVLVQGLKIARKGKAGYSILDPSPGVMAVIHLSQLADFFTIKQSDAAG